MSAPGQTYDRPIRWGMLGAGRIIDRWIKGARQIADFELAAIASRTPESAAAMAARHGNPRILTYQQMVEDPEIDAVYIPTPHPSHLELSLLALRHGKAVLVEKPAAVNVGEFAQMTQCARDHQTFLMEAFWTRFFPLIDRMHALFTCDGIGQVRAIQCAFSSAVPEDNPGHRALNPNLAGGGLLDVGVYCLQFCDLIYGQAPEQLTGYAAINSDEKHFQVDEQAMWVARYPGGALASMASGVRTSMRDTALIYGTRGSIEVPKFWKPTRMLVTIGGQTHEVVEPVPQPNPDYVDEGFQYEVQHVNDCLRAGFIESPVVPWSKTREILSQCDDLRRQWGLQYPFETKIGVTRTSN